MLKKTIPDVLATYKSKICCLCANNVESEKSSKELIYQLPCKCVICCEDCLDQYLRLVLNNPGLMCLCGNNLTTNELRQIYEFLNSNDLTYQKKAIMVVFEERLRNTCMICLQDRNLSDQVHHLVVFKDDSLTLLFKEKYFKHIICNKCFSHRAVKVKNSINCTMCFEDHVVYKVKKKFDEKEDNCLVF